MKNKIKLVGSLLGITLVFLVVGCSKKKKPTEPKDYVEINEEIEFSGYMWSVKKGYEGPGPNHWLNSTQNVIVDNDRLHLKIVRRDGTWYCSEVIAQRDIATGESIDFGYGKYVFELETKVDDLDQNVVLGLYTWDDANCPKQVNSEIDIEVSKWAGDEPHDILLYSVQPTNYNPHPHCTAENKSYDERKNKSPMVLEDDLTTHIFNWTETEVGFLSYHGHGEPVDIINHWQFSENDCSTHGSRSALCPDCSESNAICIPAPGSQTHARINLWLIGGRPPASEDCEDVEVIISKFEYTPEESDPSIIAVSRFDYGMDGWSCKGDGTCSWCSSAGNPGGFLKCVDPARGVNTDAIAPSAFLGDWTALDGKGILRFDLTILSSSGDHNQGPNVTISGDGGSASASLPPTSGPPVGAWQTYGFSIDESSWEVSSGTWQDILRNVNQVAIDMEFVNGVEETGLDNVMLVRP